MKPQKTTWISEAVTVTETETGTGTGITTEIGTGIETETEETDERAVIFSILPISSSEYIFQVDAEEEVQTTGSPKSVGMEER